ncbi:recombinase family protein [Sphingomonas sp. LY54]|nr:recombinase family protein [Sphingomonas sp. LY54]WRP30257.1 recombinase family protein [Sphingomonas sp. LY54]
MAHELNSRGIITPRGGKWHPSSVRNLLARIGDVA